MVVTMLEEQEGNGGLKSQAVSSSGLQLSLAEHGMAYLSSGRLGAVLRSDAASGSAK